jgi:hypothetical protein
MIGSPFKTGQKVTVRILGTYRAVTGTIVTIDSMVFAYGGGIKVLPYLILDLHKNGEKEMFPLEHISIQFGPE